VLADNLAEVSNEEVLADEGKKNGKAAAKSGSWASLVARAPVPSVSAPATAAAPAPTAVAVKQVETATAPAPVGAPAPPTVAPSSKGKTGTTASAPSTHLPMHKRDPDCTLVIKNISFQATEPDVVGMFEPFAKQTDATIMSITVSAHKGIAFVDYSEAAPVLAAVELHKTDPLQLHGRVLDIYQKTLEQRNRKGGPGRSGFAGSGGGRQYRGGRGDRGGGGRSGRGGR
jgi:RNA recognition motif-containing protein